MEGIKVTITVTLPPAVAAQAEDVARLDPAFLSRVVMYGLMRRTIYQELQKERDNAVDEMTRSVFGEAMQMVASDETEVICDICGGAHSDLEHNPRPAR